MTTDDLPDTAPVQPPHPGVLPGEHLRALGARLRGELVLPSDDNWDEARRAWALLTDQQPAAVAIAADAADVSEIVRSARKLGLRVVPQGTGHAAGTLPDLRDALLLRTSRLAEVTVDPAKQTVRVGAGAVWSDVVAAAGRHGLAAVAGMAPTVGVAGFVLGGGIGWFARSHGLASQSLYAIEGIDAHGEPVRADATEHPELLWAARGGSVPFVVTSLELRLYQISELTAGGLIWPIERSAEIVRAWREWTTRLPDAVTSLVRVLRYPPIPEIPEIVRGRALVAIEVAAQVEGAAVTGLLEPLRALQPEIDTVRPMRPAELAVVHGDPERPAPAYGDSQLVAELSDQAIEAFLAAALAPQSSPLLSIEIRQLGGALSRTPMAAGGDGVGAAVSGIDGEGLVYAVGIVPVPQALDAVRAAASAVSDALSPFASGRVVKTFAERQSDAAALYGDAEERLKALRAEWDPDSQIVTGHLPG
ncbi:FAD/FMN-containing dehydrogenase [Microbacterium trichothecenolyticum]|uniref:FAD-binding oxidoreductase n=1 Tax=Microbacterium trichothecenolyticum TaxID=69370 RepID=UPI00285B6909|nr:FAD-binding oxidoreductase [Microbacterium trichothecenolyticum]MDR7186829.1 FAD/FMN-containing dehydrogenase [Microbacterium trichothecenolyticum]